MKNLNVSFELGDDDVTQYSVMASFEYTSNGRVNVTQLNLDQTIKKIFVDSLINISVKVKCKSNCDEDVCNIGYYWNGIKCGDVDECTRNTNTCDANATCYNTDGSYTCACNTGYSGDGTVCTDDDECVSNPCGQGSCTNNLGGYSCSCDDGYILSQTTPPACLIRPVLVLAKYVSAWKTPIVIKNKG